MIPGFMIQGGGMDADDEGEADPGADQERGEERPAQRPRHVAMARHNDPDSATAQFFINVKDNAALDYGISGAGYAVFGEVIEGMDVVDRSSRSHRRPRARTRRAGAHRRDQACARGGSRGA